jgi:hypothetical protein
MDGRPAVVSACLVVVTMGDRSNYLVPLLADAGMPAVVVRTDVAGETRTTQPVQDGAYPLTVMHDVSTPNLSRWWNRGIDRAVSQGADVVVVCADDAQAGVGALLELAMHVEVGSAGPMLVWPEDWPCCADRPTEISGWCFALDPAAIRPDEAFCWWYGDHDLEIRARGMRPGGALGVRGLMISHGSTASSLVGALRASDEVDRVAFTRRYPALMHDEVTA